MRTYMYNKHKRISNAQVAIDFRELVTCKNGATLQDKPANVQDHPNLGLLPSGCGFMTSKLIGGNQTMLYELPWMAMLSYSTAKGNKLLCAGTLFNERYVLTAAHCVSSIGERTLNGVILGEHDVRTDPDCETSAGDLICGAKVMNVTVEEVIPHPGFKVNNQIITDDIALLRLAQPVDFKLESVDPVCLPRTTKLQHESLVDEHGSIAGWGLSKGKIDLPILSKFPVSIVSSDECQTIYNGIISKPPQLTSKHICVRSRANFGGDAGGPLIVFGETGTGYAYVQRGVMSFGPRVQTPDIPDVYTNVAYYMKWILDNIRN